MLFNSIDFAVFLPIVYFLYWVAGSKALRYQNLLIVVSSFIFYGWWDWRFLPLMMFSATVDFFSALAIARTDSVKRKRLFVAASCVANLGILGFFKYYNFFIQNFSSAFKFLGYSFDDITLRIILPVGISFYTFQALSYTFDVYRGKLKPTRNIIDYLAFISFFPQLVAGPIERATNLLPQIINRRTFNYVQSVDGMRLILWGLFKKVVIADSLARFVDEIFSHYTSYNGATLFMGAVYFAIQIYCDFSGYSDIAIGVSKLFGIELMSNFRFPYFSRDIGDFWRRWHISLTTWFKDYVYVPLGGSRNGKFITIRNVFIIFIVSGLWHGANWTFVIWGVLHAVIFTFLIVSGRNEKNSNQSLTLRFAGQAILTFLIVTIFWVFFRSANATDSCQYLSRMFDVTHFGFPESRKFGVVYVVVLFVFEWFQRPDERRPLIFIRPRPLRSCLYFVLVIVILLKLNSYSQFIYFQF